MQAGEVQTIVNRVTSEIDDHDLLTAEAAFLVGRRIDHELRAAGATDLDIASWAREAVRALPSISLKHGIGTPLQLILEGMGFEITVTHPIEGQRGRIEVRRLAVA